MSAIRTGRQDGFTLLETVVTLVIVAMLVSMLMQALNQSMQLRTRILRVQAQSRQMLLQEAWFRESVVAAQPPTLRGVLDAFDGAPQEISYVSGAPLAAQAVHGCAGGLAPTPMASSPCTIRIRRSATRWSCPGRCARRGSRTWTPAASGFRSGRAPPDDALDEPGADAGVLPRLLLFIGIDRRGTRLHWMVHLPANLRASNRIDSAGDGGRPGDRDDDIDTRPPRPVNSSPRAQTGFVLAVTLWLLAGVAVSVGLMMLWARAQIERARLDSERFQDEVSVSETRDTLLYIAATRELNRAGLPMTPLTEEAISMRRLDELGESPGIRSAVSCVWMVPATGVAARPPSPCRTRPGCFRSSSPRRPGWTGSCRSMACRRSRSPAARHPAGLHRQGRPGTAGGCRAA
ncbi:type II secretion system protein [Pseudoxanthomonas sp. NC8]|nr:type II secretion system protein [Pseudoxanthomonas sp. NC8]